MVTVNSGNATPITYEVNGKQFVVIAAFGGYGSSPRAGVAATAPPGGAFVAFALPLCRARPATRSPPCCSKDVPVTETTPTRESGCDADAIPPLMGR
jgi:hypothetical protein